MIDIHCHILPGIDDGADTLQESVEFCRIAAADGIDTIVATPHMRYDTFPNTREGILGAHRRLAERLETERIGLRLVPGAEVHFAPDLAERCRKGALLTYGDGGRYLLLELPYLQFPAGVEDAVFQLRVQGVTPVLAHPERIAYFVDDPDRLGRLLELGALTQFTASSITGKFGEQVREFCREMLLRGWVDSIATDAHDLTYRPPRLAEAAALLSEWIGDEATRRLVEGVPRGILEGRGAEELAGRRPQEPPRRRSRWFGRHDPG